DPADAGAHELVGVRGEAGEASVVLSLQGDLRRLAITPARSATLRVSAAVSWTDLLAAAGLPPPSELEELPADDFLPPMFADERHVGRGQDAVGEDLRIYAAAYAGSPVYFTSRLATTPAPGAASAGSG